MRRVVAVSMWIAAAAFAASSRTGRSHRGKKLAFSSSGDGTTTIAHEDSPAKLTVVQTLKTGERARTMALDPATHRIYLATAKFEAPPAGAAPGRGRATIVPNSMKILVHGLNGQ